MKINNNWKIGKVEYILVVFFLDYNLFLNYHLKLQSFLESNQAFG
jgi:hypothetical protein